jgi:hypothetical protein
LAAQVLRNGKPVDLAITLPNGWRRLGNITWRATTWDLRRMGLGGMVADDLSADERRAVKLPEDAMALKVRYLGEYGEHAVAKRAGLLKGDVVVAFDGHTGRMSESELLAYTVQRKRPGDEVAVTVIRDGARKSLRFALQ